MMVFFSLGLVVSLLWDRKAREHEPKTHATVETRNGEHKERGDGGGRCRLLVLAIVVY